MTLHFEKYQGTGNDFVMIDNREDTFNAYKLPISEICDRRFGIGADGVIVIENHAHLDFNMIYFNPDGSQSFCGNGSRCAVAFAKSLGIIEVETKFLSTDGEHYATIKDELVELKMHDVFEVGHHNQAYVIDTGSPHHISFVASVDDVNIIANAHVVRYNDVYKESGINVNFVEVIDGGIKIRTYERGVEDETLSCGTGVTAAALAAYVRDDKSSSSVKTRVISRGGELMVRFNHDTTGFHDIFLIGPAKKTFSGSIEL